MKINSSIVSANKSQFVASSGATIPALISKAFNITSITEDVYLEDDKGNKIPFVLIPLTEGKIVVGLAGSEGEKYTISEAEVSASIGLPLSYLISVVYQEGTTITNFNIGV